MTAARESVDLLQYECREPSTQNSVAAEFEAVLHWSPLHPKMKVLIVDDDPKFRSYIRQGLELNGLDCDVAEDVERGLKVVAGGYDMVLLDVMMPGATGWDFLAQLRARGDATPVIFLTARNQLDERVRGLRSGADDYIIKPFELSELIARIEAVIRRRQSRVEFDLGDLHVDLIRRDVTKAGERVDLSPREFEVLLALVEARGGALSRADLLKSVWGMDFDPGTNVVEVQVAHLRRKLDQKGQRLIHTVPGQGYRLSLTEVATD